jgi:surface polysaccharide O-acyltransferase-like enzyme
VTLARFRELGLRSRGVAVQERPTGFRPSAADVAGAAPAASLRQRRVDVELVRIMAILFVATIHVTAQVAIATHGHGTSGQLSLLANAFSRAGAPLFFAISGWLLIGRGPAADEGRWIAGRLRRLLVPLAVWSAVFVLQALIISAWTNVPLWTDTQGPLPWLAHQIIVTLAGPGDRAHLWFMYSLATLTAVIWMVQAAARAKPWALATVAVLLFAAIGVPATFGVPSGWSSVEWPFCYAVLGYLVLSRPPHPLVGLALFIGSSIAIYLATQYAGYDRWPNFYQGPLVLLATLGVILSVPAITIPQRLVPVVLGGAKLTFGFYLAHPMVLSFILLAVKPGGVPELALLWLVTVGGSYALALAWHRSRSLSLILG